MSQNTAKHFSIQLQGVNHKCRILVFPVIRLYLERAFGGDTDVVWSWWVSDLETSCLACRDGMIIPSLKMGVESPAHLSCLCNSFTHWCYTVSALWWDTVTFPGALWWSILFAVMTFYHQRLPVSLWSCWRSWGSGCNAREHKCQDFHDGQSNTRELSAKWNKNDLLCTDIRI